MRESDGLSLALVDEAATRRLGAELARALDAGAVGARLVTLAGDLGAGKTTLVRGFLEALGVAGPVRSPTYTLLESYPAGGRCVHHFDWYRLAGEEDLEALGYRDLLDSGAWILAEWPERVPSVAGRADVAVHLDYESPGRRARLRAQTPAGKACVDRIRSVHLSKEA